MTRVPTAGPAAAGRPAAGCVAEDAAPGDPAEASEEAARAAFLREDPFWFTLLTRDIHS